MLLALAITGAVGWLGFPGLLWDVAWHRTVGRDSFLSPPHLLMYAGVGASGLFSAWALATRVRLTGVRVVATGFALTMVGAVLDEAWHHLIGKDVNLWSPPHLVGLAGTVLILLGLALAFAARLGYGARPGWRAPRVLMLFFCADLVHKSTVALDHYTLDPWGRTAGFYPFLIALMQPAILVLAIRAAGRGAAAGTALVFSAQHITINLVLLAAGMRTATFSPLPILPALALDAVVRSAGAIPAALGGVAFSLVMYAQEAAWMWWIVERPWTVTDVLRGIPAALLAGAGSAWVGWVVGGLVSSAASGRPLRETFGDTRRTRLVAVATVLIVLAGIASAYRPSRLDPPATVAALNLAPDTRFDHRDATFWDALLPDDWAEPGTRETYQEAIIDGHGVPLGPSWCSKDAAALDRALAHIRFALEINGERVPLDGYPRVRRRVASGDHCEWIGVRATTPRPGDQRLVYTLDYGAPVDGPSGPVGPGRARVVVALRIKEP